MTSPETNFFAPPSFATPSSGTGHAARLSTRELLLLAVGAVGIVYGDIGTSPLYAIKECFDPVHGVAAVAPNIFGVLSLVFWTLVLIVVVKYMTVVLRADNNGEGGILALMALVSPRTSADQPMRSASPLILLGLLGTALLLAEGIITPAISVLSAVEGLEVVTPAFSRFVMPISLGILAGLFWCQKRGTGNLGMIFGPATIVWFISIAAAGLPWIIRQPAIVAAVNPWHAIRFLIEQRHHAFLVLSSVVLCITGTEALYADLGHFGSRPIRIAWYALAFPALLLNYFGQGALLLANPTASNPFYSLVGNWALYPMIFIATIATIIASQALISGAYSLAQQAVQLGYLPMLKIVHTSGKMEGQIYVPSINKILAVGCLALVLIFRSSTNLASAYGLAVMGTMTMTSILLFSVIRRRWKWKLWQAGLLVGVLLCVDLTFLSSTLVKFFHGGWIPILVGATVFTIMATWKKGRSLVAKSLFQDSLSLEMFAINLEKEKIHRVRGTAVFMSSNPAIVPPALLHHLKHNKVLHRQVIVLSIITTRVPKIAPEHELKIRMLAENFHQVLAYHGFTQTPHVPSILAGCESHGLKINLNEVSFYLGSETILTSGRSKMALWRKILFTFLTKNARPATVYFGIPPNQVIELGAQIEI